MKKYYYFRLRNLYFNTILFFKSKYQLFRYGFEFRDCWSLDYSTARYLVPRLEHLKKTKHGCPIFCYKDLNKEFFTEEDDKEAIENWGTILDKMIFGFEFILNQDKYETACYPKDYNWGFDISKDGNLTPKDKRKPDYTEYKELEKRALEGRILFAQHFESLWN